MYWGIYTDTAGNRVRWDYEELHPRRPKRQLCTVFTTAAAAEEKAKSLAGAFNQIGVERVPASEVENRIAADGTAFIDLAWHEPEANA